MRQSWAPLFYSIVDSSLWEEPDHVVKVFITMLAMKDSDHVVWATPYAIGKRCWRFDPGAEAKVNEALQVLSSPDTRRAPGQRYEGRRIERTPCGNGWLVLNGQFYENEMKKLNRRSYQAGWARGKRIGGSTARERLAVEAYGNGETELAEEIASRGLPDPRNGCANVSSGEQP